MSRFFSDFVRSLAHREEISNDGFDAAWLSLRRLLSRELRRRGLADQPPAYLGVYGFETWFAPGEASDGFNGRRTDALEELVADSFSYIFCHRLQSLNAQLQIKDSIEGLIHLNIRHFIHDRQRIHDPIGLRTYEIARAAVEGMVQAGQMWRVDAGRKLRSGTLLAFSEVASETPPARDLGPRVRSWNDTLMPDLLVVRGAARQALVEDLRQRVLSLREEGIESFRFGELLQPLRYDVRARWAALYDGDHGDRTVEDLDDLFQTMTRKVAPASDYEERESFDQLIDCVERRLARPSQRPDWQGQLTTLWRFLRTEALGGTVESKQWIVGESSSRPRSTRRLAELLGIPRTRMPKLFATLGSYLERCRGKDTSASDSFASNSVASNSVASNSVASNSVASSGKSHRDQRQVESGRSHD